MDDACEACPESCSNCESANYCLTCSPGYFMLKDKREPTGMCGACSEDHFCATCEKSPSKCTSCIEGYTLRGKKCRSSEFVRCGFKLDTTLAGFMTSIFNFKIGICNYLGGVFLNRPELINFYNIGHDGTSLNLDFDFSLPTGAIAFNIFSFFRKIQIGTVFGGISCLQAPNVLAQGFVPETCPGLYCD